MGIWTKVESIMEKIFLFFGMMFFVIFTHELVHVIDGWQDNIAMCFGFFSWKRVAFVVNGDHYTLFRGELLAHSITVVILILIMLIWHKAKKEKQNGKKNKN